MKNKKRTKKQYIENKETLMSIKLKEAIDKIACDKLNELSKKNIFFKKLKDIKDEKF